MIIDNHGRQNSTAINTISTNNYQSQLKAIKLKTQNLLEKYSDHAISIKDTKDHH